MFLDCISFPAKFNHQPYYMFIYSFLLTIISTILSYFILPKELISLGILMFITIGAVPLFSKVFSYNSFLSNYNKGFFKRHSSILKILAYFFFGVFFAYICVFFVLSSDYGIVDLNNQEVLELNSYDDSIDYSLKVNVFDYDNKILEIYLLDKDNKIIESSLFSEGEYISFNNLNTSKSFLITNIKQDKISLSYGNGLREKIFFTQFSEMQGVSNIKTNITGKFASESTNNKSMFSKVFSLILKNNLRVVLIAGVLSFLYGAGAIFLIAWNASILAAVVSLDIFLGMAPVIVSGAGGFFKGVFNSLYLFLGYLPHGIPEIGAYFIISFAGAIFSRDLFKGLLSTEFRWKILKDTFYLIGLAILLLIIGALIEASYFI